MRGGTHLIRRCGATFPACGEGWNGGPFRRCGATSPRGEVKTGDGGSNTPALRGHPFFRKRGQGE